MWKQLFKKKRLPVFGLQITSNHLISSYIEFLKEQQPTLTYFDIHPLSSISSNETLPYQKSAIAISDDHVTTKKINLSKILSTRKIKQLLIEELRALNFSDFYFDYQIETKTHTPTLSLITISKNTLHSHLATINKTIFIPKIVEPESHSIERFFYQFYPELQHQSFCLITISFAQTLLKKDILISYYIFSKNQLIFTKKENTPADILHETISKITQKILHYYYSLNNQKIINHLFLISDEIPLKSIKIQLREILKIETNILNPFAKLIISKHINKNYLQNYNLNTLISLGLALRTL